MNAKFDARAESGPAMVERTGPVRAARQATRRDRDGMKMALPAASAETLRFAAVGLVSTALYLALASFGDAGLRLPPAAASLLAYALAGVFSYFAHRRITFRSSLSHREALLRFALLTVAGYAVALGAPIVLVDVAKLPAPIAFAFVSLAVPALNFLLMRRVVFRPAAPKQALR